MVVSLVRITSPSAGLITWIDRILKEEKIDPIYRDAILHSLSALWSERHPTESKASKFDLLTLPALCCQALGGDALDVLELNIAWSLLYAAFYLLDKVEDSEDIPLLNEIIGSGEVTNVATGLIFCAELTLAKLALDQKFDLATMAFLLASFNRMALRTCSGQHLDLSLKEPDIIAVWKSVSAKSGDFFALACLTGASLKTKDQNILDAFETFGRHLGVLIQIANDIEGMWGIDGKSSDIARGKVTLPVAYALHVLAADKKVTLKHLFLSSEGFAEAEARRMIIECGALIYLLLEAEKHRRQAKIALQNLNLQPLFKEGLEDILGRICRITSTFVGENKKGMKE